MQGAGGQGVTVICPEQNGPTPVGQSVAASELLVTDWTTVEFIEKRLYIVPSVAIYFISSIHSR